MKETWRYLCDKCDHAGFWDLDMETLSHFVNQKVTVDDLKSNFGDRLFFVKSDKIWISGFIEFQYGCGVSDLNPNNKVHLSVMNLLKKYGVSKGYPSPLQGAKDKDKEKEKDKDNYKHQNQISDAQRQENRFRFNYLSVINDYPNFQKKNRAMIALSEKIKTQEEFENLKVAVKNFADYHQREGTERKYIPFLHNWLEDFEDWLKPELIEEKKGFDWKSFWNEIESEKNK
jgi:hypothetical protein